MSLHEVLVTAETALIYSVIGGLVAWAFAHRPLRRQRQIADRLDTETPGGITDVVRAIEDAGPPPTVPTRHPTDHR